MCRLLRVEVARTVRFAALAWLALAACSGSKKDDGGQGENPPANEVRCSTLAPLPAGACAVTPGSAGLLLLGDVLVPGKIYRGGGVAVNASGTITCVGCDCVAGAPLATRVTCPEGIVSPGLVNAHEHLGYSPGSPAADTGERYDDRHQWMKGLEGHTQLSVGPLATAQQQEWNELRHVMGGATSVIGTTGTAGLLRNLDRQPLLEGLLSIAATSDTWPLSDSNVAGLSTPPPCSAFTGAVSTLTVATASAWLGHVGEGIGPYAAAELTCLSDANPGHDALGFKSAIVNTIGLDAMGWAKVGQTGTRLVWSPRSNVRLYGDTAQAALADRLGVRIALGTDWVFTGSMNMLRELKCADGWNRDRLGGHFTDEELWLMATRNGAEVAGVQGQLGMLAAGKWADVAVFDGRIHPDHRAVIDAEAADVLLVLRGGTALYGEAAVVAALDATCDTVDVCGVMKRVCLQGQVGESWASLSTANSGSYPAFACGTPAAEPTCTPSRPNSVNGSTVFTGTISATDDDGDGIADAQDGCAAAFNPVRPMDGGVQADVDADGVPDACDVCAVDAGTATCNAPDPDDVDGDGVANEADNCPSLWNDQVDQDGDGKGDACDACAAYNPGLLACPATIYQVKDGTVPVGSVISLPEAVVTGWSGEGYFLQVPMDASGYAGADYSGVYVYDPTNTRAVGERVSIGSATVTYFNGQLQLTSPAQVTWISSGNPPPAPVAVTPAEVTTGGTRAAALEGVVVEVTDVAVTDVSPLASPGDPTPASEFVVDAVLRVDDLLYLVYPWPDMGTAFASISGVLAFRHGDSKLQPRDASDFVLGPPTLVAFGPAGFVDVGATGVPTHPTALRVMLSSINPSDVFVSITSSDEAALTVVDGGVTIPAGNGTAQVLVNGVAQSAGVTLTAMYDGATLTSNVRVIGPAEPPVVASLEPAAPTVSAWGTVTLTVTLDLPAPAGGTVVALSVDPAYGGVDPTVVVPAGELSWTFDYVDQGMGPSATVTATLGASTASSTITVVASGTLVINEVDYDNIGTDVAEFVEIYNGMASDVDLSGYALVLVNGGDNSEYRRWDLSGTLAAGQYLVVGASSVVAALPGGVLAVDGGTQDLLQNGAPDGVALVDTLTQVVVDALSYEGPITAATITGLTGPVSLVEGSALPAATADSNAVQGTLCRNPNGADSGDASVDWSFCTTATPGAANVP